MFLVGQYRDRAAMDHRRWEFQGVFSTREKAVAACVAPGFFIFPVTLDQVLPSETLELDPEYPFGGPR